MPCHGPYPFDELPEKLASLTIELLSALREMALEDGQPVGDGSVLRMTVFWPSLITVSVPADRSMFKVWVTRTGNVMRGDDIVVFNLDESGRKFVIWNLDIPVDHARALVESAGRRPPSSA